LKKDIAFKELIKDIAKDIATYLLKIDISDNIEIINKEFTRIEKREADLVFKDKNNIFHIEIQNQNDKLMHLRMLRYLSDIAFLYPKNNIFQYVIYIGKNKLNMKNYYKNDKIDYSYNLIDMKNIDCKEFLNLNNEGVILAILCNFKDKNKKEIINEIIKKLYKFSKTKDEFLKNIEILTIFSTNRNLEEEIKKGVKMLTKIELEKIPFYQDGFKDGFDNGFENGFQNGEKKGLLRGKIITMLEFGLSFDEIAKRLNFSKEEVINILEGKK